MNQSPALELPADPSDDADLEEIPRRSPEIDLALLHLGGTKIFGVLLTVDAGRGVEAVTLIDAGTSIPIHYDGYEVFRSPLSAFQRAVADAGLEDRVAHLARGETYAFEIPRTDGERYPSSRSRAAATTSGSVIVASP